MNHKRRYSASNQYRGLEEALNTILEDSNDGLEYDLAIQNQVLLPTKRRVLMMKLLQSTCQVMFQEKSRCLCKILALFRILRTTAIMNHWLQNELGKTIHNVPMNQVMHKIDRL
ncbi:hypothetical protein HW555_011475 [Spodoptera exigua]|uniref:Uncharacterized protein n=1 Tax=Spodoptera exigua TaxID=7107 RepID=A0A835G8G8_SPOEX|nr:hypothetical protein HW555_011475 [Spodoptera exigua]